jgi:hypothetical protein
MSGQRGRILLNKPARGHFGLSRWRLLFAAPFLAVGAWVAGIGVGVFPQQPGTAALPPWLAAVIGIIFFVVGLYLVSEMLRGMAGRALARRGRDMAPWRFDHHWSGLVVHDETGWSAYRSLAGACAFGVFVAVLHMPLFLEPDPKRLPVMLYVVLGLFDLILLGLLLVARRLRYGRTRVRLNTFPFYMGDALEVALEGGAALADRHGLRATLRCVEEAVETHGQGKDSTTGLVCYQIYGEQRMFDTDPRGHAALSFALPADLPGNRLLDMPPTYWEIEVRVTQPGVDYVGIFLMPVYRAPA